MKGNQFCFKTYLSVEEHTVCPEVQLRCVTRRKLSLENSKGVIKRIFNPFREFIGHGRHRKVSKRENEREEKEREKNQESVKKRIRVGCVSISLELCLFTLCSIGWSWFCSVLFCVSESSHMKALYVVFRFWILLDRKGK